jgi:phospholipase D1/2
MPFSEEFWKQGAPVAKAPKGVQGFITRLPIDWTEGENNHPGMNMILLTQLDQSNTSYGVAVAEKRPLNDSSST